MKLVFHPEMLKDPEIGPVVQQKLQDGSAVLAEKLCEQCQELRDAAKNLLANMSKEANYGKSWSSYQVDDDSIEQLRAVLEHSK